MPQLNRSPWLAILMTAWLIFIIVIPTKVLAYTYPNDPSVCPTAKSKFSSWNWPWH